MTGNKDAKRLEELLEEAETSVKELSTDGGEDVEIEAAARKLRALWRVAEEAQDLLEDIDLEEIPDAVDEEAVIRAIKDGDISKAIEEGNATEAVDLRALVKAINLHKLFADIDMKQVWADSNELKEATDEAMAEMKNDETSEGGSIPDAATDAIGDETNGGEEGLTESAKDVGDDVKSGLSDAVDDIGGFGGSIPDEGYQMAIQKQALEGVDKFREGVLEAHDKLKKLHDENRERMRRQYEDKRVESRNPTAYSTLPTDRLDVGGKASHYSTVPRDTRYSSVPNRERIYGHRFEHRDR